MTVVRRWPPLERPLRPRMSPRRRNGASPGRRALRWVVSGVTTLALLSVVLGVSARSAPVPDGPYVTRLSVPDVGALSADLARRFTFATSTVYVASGEQFPDAIAGIPLVADAPLFLTTADGGVDIAAGLFRPSDVRRAVLLGGTDAVSATAETAIRTRFPRALLVRVAGGDRYATAALIADVGHRSETVLIVSGRNYADALAAGAAAARTGAPVLLTEATRLPGATTSALRRLGTRRVHVIGGEGVVGPAVLEQLRAMGITTRRISGADRFGTANAVAEEFFAGAHQAFLVSGDTFQAPLIASAAAAHTGSPVLLRRDSCTPASVQDYVAGSGISSVVNVAVADGRSGGQLNDSC